jgi:hypothetical protein
MIVIEHILCTIVSIGVVVRAASLPKGGPRRRSPPSKRSAVLSGFEGNRQV